LLSTFLSSSSTFCVADHIEYSMFLFSQCFGSLPPNSSLYLSNAGNESSPFGKLPLLISPIEVFTLKLLLSIHVFNRSKAASPSDILYNVEYVVSLISLIKSLDLIGSKSLSMWPLSAFAFGNALLFNPLGDRFEEAAQPLVLNICLLTILLSIC